MIRRALTRKGYLFARVNSNDCNDNHTIVLEPPMSAAKTNPANLTRLERFLEEKIFRLPPR